MCGRCNAREQLQHDLLFLAFRPVDTPIGARRRVGDCCQCHEWRHASALDKCGECLRPVFKVEQADDGSLLVFFRTSQQLLAQQHRGLV